MNYLILTPDGVGSTYLQRVLTVYFNCAGKKYWNTHELLNGLDIEEGNLYKDETIGYKQSVKEIAQLITDSKNSIVSRIAKYHIHARLVFRQEDYTQLYNVCNKKFGQIFYCTRDPFEYALSWSIRRETDVSNVYSVDERIDVHNLNRYRNIDLVYFHEKLQEYGEYEYWAEDNFNVTRSVEYDSLHQNVDNMMQELTGLSHSVQQSHGVSLQDYSRIRYLSSMYKQTKDSVYSFDCQSIIEDLCSLRSFIDMLRDHKQMPTGIPIKMNTLEDKKKRVLNFNRALDQYNTWASKGNRHPELSEDDINQKINREKQIYVDK